MSTTDICAGRTEGRTDPATSMQAHQPHTYTDWSGRTVDCPGITHTPTSEPLEAPARVLRVEVEPMTYTEQDVAFYKAMGRKVPTAHLQVRAVFDVPLGQNASHWIVVTNRKMADRLAAAMQAGVVFTDFRACTNIYGAPYLGMKSNVMGKYLNADLKALGF